MATTSVPFERSAAPGELYRASWATRLWRTARRKPLGVAAVLVLLVVTLLSLTAPLVTPSRYDHQNLTATLESPGRAHALGTDELGRETFSRIIYGARVSLGVGVAAVVMGLTIGMLSGLLCGYAGGRTDMALQRLMDAMHAMPLLLTAMV